MIRNAFSILLCAVLAFPAAASNQKDFPGMRGANGGLITTSSVIVTPGSTAYGSWALTAQPPNQGSSSDYGYYDNAIGVWDIVPFQTFTGNIQTCVAAFHAPTATEYSNGITNNVVKVSFAINGGTYTDVTTPTANPVTGQLEYCATVRAQDFATDGNFEERAVIYPSTGVPLVLQGSPLFFQSTSGSDAQIGVVQTYNPPSIKSLTLNANYHGTLPTYTVYADSINGNDANNCKTKATACATIFQARNNCYTYLTGAFGGTDIGGCSILLEAGNYNLGISNTTGNGTSYTNKYRWLDVSPDTGVGTSAVIDCYGSNAIYVPGSAATTCTGTHFGLNVSRVHLKGVEVQFVPGAAMNSGLGRSGSQTGIWSENVTFVGNGSNSGEIYLPQTFALGTYLTNSDASQMQNGCLYCDLVQSSTIHNIVSDSFQNSYAVIGSLSYQANGYYTGFGNPLNTGDLTSGSPVVNNVVDISQIKVGASLGDTPWPVTVISSVGIGGGCATSNCFVMAANATSTVTGQAITSGAHPDFYQSGSGYVSANYSNASNIVTGIPNFFYFWYVGMPIDGTNIPPNTYVTQVCHTGSETGCSVSGSIILSATPTGAGTSITYGRNNVVLYGNQSYQSRNQGIFIVIPSKDNAIVNNLVCNQSQSAACNTSGVTLYPNDQSLYIAQFNETTTNMFLLNSSLNGPIVFRTDQTFVGKDVTFVNMTCPYTAANGGITNRSTAISVSTNLNFYGGTC